MAQSVTMNGSTYSIPESGNRQWGTNVTNYLVALSTATLQKSGGNFTLTADANFGANYGLVAAYFKSRGTNPAASGILRLANNEGVGFRNAANSADKILKLDSNDKWAFGASAVSEAELGYLAGVTSAIQTQIDGKQAAGSYATSTDLTNHEADTSTHGVGTIVGTSETQALTNKDYDGGTASNTSRITVPKAASATLSGLTRKQGTLLYDTTLGKLLLDDGTNLNQVGSGSGAGGVTLIANPSDAGSWSETGTVFATPATTTTSGDLPLSGATPTAIQFVATGNGAEASHYNSYSVTTSAAMNGKLQVDFFMRPGTGFAASEWTVSVYQGSTRQTLDRDSSGVCYLPNTTGRFTVTFDAVASTAYTLRFARISGSGSATLNVCNVFLGWPFVSSIAANRNWETITFPTPTNLGTGTATNTAFFKQVGDTMIAKLQTVKDASGGSGASGVSWTMPSGHTINTAALPSNRVLGTASFNGANYGPRVDVRATSSTAFTIVKSGGGGFTGADFTANGDVEMDIVIPIAEWAGSVSTGPVPAEEFAYNSSTTNTDDTTSFAYGPAGGSLIGSNPVSGGITKRVRFQYPIQSDDEIVVEVAPLGDGKWFQLPCLDNSQFPLESLHQEGSNFFGLGIYMTSGLASNEVAVKFGQYPDSHTSDSSGYNWSSYSAWKWRVRKTKKASLPFANASSSASGLVAARKGQTSLTVTSSAAGWSTVRAVGVYYQDQDGNHRLKFNIVGNITSKTLVQSDTVTVSGIVAKNTSAYSQTVSAWNNGSKPWTGAIIDPNAAVFYLYADSSTGVTRICLSGDIELESKPTWA